jgi:hypothetical protein
MKSSRNYVQLNDIILKEYKEIKQEQNQIVSPTSYDPKYELITKTKHVSADSIINNNIGLLMGQITNC